MESKLIFLGTGTSMGVPTLGCACAVCTSTNPHDTRLRPSVAITWTEPASDVQRVVLIDTGPDFRQQALNASITRVDAVFYTHAHADHILGMDDLRPLSFAAEKRGGFIPLYADAQTRGVLERVYDYTFSPHATYPNRARVELKPVAEHNTVHGIDFIRVPLMHGDMEITGFRFGNAAYLTDVSAIPESSFTILEGVEVLVLSALRHIPHPSHATVEQAVKWAQRIGARETWLTHIAHDLGHEVTNRSLPPNIRVAYDGLVRPIALFSGESNSMAGAAPNESANRMAVYRSIAEVPAGFGPSIAAIGNFDGVHLGHQEILSSAVSEARLTNARAVAITFDPHPQQFLRPDRAPRLITPLAERLRRISLTGVDAALVLPFNAELARLSAEEFALDVLAQKLRVRGMHEGNNFRFGRGAAAGVKELTELGGKLGFHVHVHGAVKVHGLEVASSTIRKLVAAGDVRRARWMLGTPFSIFSTPARGRGIGSRLLVPTVNLAPSDGLLPAFGVYVTRLKIAGRAFDAVTNVGNRPTFGEPSFAIESHILDFEPINLNDDTPLELQFLMRLRGEIAWPTAEALKAQIVKDVARAKRYFRLANINNASD